MCLNKSITTSTGTYSENIERLKAALAECDAVFMGVGAGLSTAAGFTYSGERFEKYFSGFHQKLRYYRYVFRRLLSLSDLGGILGVVEPPHRYVDIPRDTYKRLLDLVREKDYFVLTTNVDHCFQRSGFDKERLFVYRKPHARRGWFGSAYSYTTGQKNSFWYKMSLRSLGCKGYQKEDIIMSKYSLDDTHSLSHTKWNCKYHIVFSPKYRRKAFYGEKRQDIGVILRKLCEWKGVTILEGEVCIDHVHILVEIPPKMAVSSFMGYLKGKSSLMIYETWGNARFKYRNREFWCRGYYVDTVGKNTKAIAQYIQNQLKEDAASDQLTMEDIDPFTGSK